jgi:hypothetical protein
VQGADNLASTLKVCIELFCSGDCTLKEWLSQARRLREVVSHMTSCEEMETNKLLSYGGSLAICDHNLFTRPRALSDSLQEGFNIILLCDLELPCCQDAAITRYTTNIER